MIDLEYDCASRDLGQAVQARTYSRRKADGTKENWSEINLRTLKELRKVGKLTDEEIQLLWEMQEQQKTTAAGRWLWVGGTPWTSEPANYTGLYNCSSLRVDNPKVFGKLMDLGMQGVGTGAELRQKHIDKLPTIKNTISVVIKGKFGETWKPLRQENTTIELAELHDFSGEPVTQETLYFMKVGDSRKGWVDAYQGLIDLAFKDFGKSEELTVWIDINDVRPKGEPLEGFGGVANPAELCNLFRKVANLLTKAVGRQLTVTECCILIDEAAWAFVAGNIRRCLPENALVHTFHGLVPIKDIQIGDLVQTPIGFRRVTNKFDQGYQDVYEIETNATNPSATLNHQIATLADAKGTIKWKKLSELESGDRLMHSKEILPGTVTHLPADFTLERPKQSRTAKDISIPELTPEIAWLIGYTHGNGYVSLGKNKHSKSYGRVEWSMNALTTELTQKIQAKIEFALKKFGLTAKHSIIQGQNTAKTSCSSVRLAEYFRRYIKQPNISLKIPSFILQGTSDVRAAYLAGLVDSDGCVNHRPPVLVTTVYKTFVHQVSSVLSSLGIVGRISTSVRDNPNWQTRYDLNVPAFKELYNSIISLHSIKSRLKEGLKAHGFTIPGKMMRKSYTYSEMREMGFSGSHSTDSNYERYIAESDVNLDIPVTVKGLGSYDHVQTYDIEVEEAHCFYCDGYLTHNSAGMRQFDSQKELLKLNLWKQNSKGEYVVDSEKEVLQIANHTRVFEKKPSYEEILSAVKLQHQSGEGAIQWAGEAIARANADLWVSRWKEWQGLTDDPEATKREFIRAYCESQDAAKQFIEDRHKRVYGYRISEKELEHRLDRIGLNPCGEIIGTNFYCNLAQIALSYIDPKNLEDQRKAFRAGGFWVAVLLHHQFPDPEMQYSREIDPIVGVSPTDLFGFFVNAFGADWLRWWQAGRPKNWGGPMQSVPLGQEFSQGNLQEWEHLSHYFLEREAAYFKFWRSVVREAVTEYCERNHLKVPNRCTTVQPSGTKSLLTNASAGWHPPKAIHYIRRLGVGQGEPVALACKDLGYQLIPAATCVDENKQLLSDINDPRSTHLQVEFPVRVSWWKIAEEANCDPAKFPATAQLDFYLQVQGYYTEHNTSGTIELRADEIPDVAKGIHKAIEEDEGYISVALLARFDDHQSFPRMPFEPISKEVYDQMVEDVSQRAIETDFFTALDKYTSSASSSASEEPAGPAACDSDKCLL